VIKSPRTDGIKLRIRGGMYEGASFNRVQRPLNFKLRPAEGVIYKKTFFAFKKLIEDSGTEVKDSANAFQSASC